MLRYRHIKLAGKGRKQGQKRRYNKKSEKGKLIDKRQMHSIYGV